MEATWLTKGGKNSRKNMPKAKASFVARKASRAAWRGHIKNTDACECPQCMGRKNKL